MPDWVVSLMYTTLERAAPGWAGTVARQVVREGQATGAVSWPKVTVIRPLALKKPWPLMVTTWPALAVGGATETSTGGPDETTWEVGDRRELVVGLEDEVPEDWLGPGLDAGAAGGLVVTEVDAASCLVGALPWGRARERPRPAAASKSITARTMTARAIRPPVALATVLLLSRGPFLPDSLPPLMHLLAGGRVRPGSRRQGQGGRVKEPKPPRCLPPSRGVKHG